MCHIVLVLIRTSRLPTKLHVQNSINVESVHRHNLPRHEVQKVPLYFILYSIIDLNFWMKASFS